MKKTLAVLAILGLAACSSSEVKKEVDQAAEKQPSRSFHGEVASKAMESIESSKDLTDNQKGQLRELANKVAVETFKTQDEMSKLKGVLFETITTKPYEREKVDVIKKKLTALNNKKLNTMFEALDSFEKIVGEMPNRNTFAHEFFHDHSY